MITKRMIVLVWAGVIPILVGMVFNLHVGLFLIYNMLLACMFLVDGIISPGPKVLKVERILESPLELGRESPVFLQVTNLGYRRMKILIKDTPPFEICGLKRAISLACEPGKQVRTGYVITPSRRGCYSFGDIYVRITGVLGLYMKQHRIPCSEEFSVYPDLQMVKKYQLLARKTHLLENGHKLRRVMGIATDFHGLREYTTDDEYRKINWKATARAHKLITNIYDVEKSQNIIIAIDTGRVMMSEADGLSRMDHSVNAALVLAGVAIARGDKVGVLVFGTEVEVFVSPRGGSSQMERIAGVLYGLQPGHYESDFTQMVSYLDTFHRKRSLVCLFSKVTNEEDSRELAGVLSVLKKRHALLMVSLLNPGLKLLANRPTEGLEAVYSKAAAFIHLRAEQNGGHILAGLGVPNIVAEPEELPGQLVKRYLIMKKQMRI